MDDNKVSVITVYIIHIANIDFRLEIVANILPNKLISFANEFFSHKMATARFRDLHRAYIRSLSWLVNGKEGSDHSKQKAHKL